MQMLETQLPGAPGRTSPGQGAAGAQEESVEEGFVCSSCLGLEFSNVATAMLVLGASGIMHMGIVWLHILPQVILCSKTRPQRSRPAWARAHSRGSWSARPATSKSTRELGRSLYARRVPQAVETQGQQTGRMNSTAIERPLPASGMTGLGLKNPSNCCLQPPVQVRHCSTLSGRSAAIFLSDLSRLRTVCSGQHTQL